MNLKEDEDKLCLLNNVNCAEFGFHAGFSDFLLLSVCVVGARQTAVDLRRGALSPSVWSGPFDWLFDKLSLPSLPRPPLALFTELLNRSFPLLYQLDCPSPFTPAGRARCVRLCVWECFTAGYSKKIIRRQPSLCIFTRWPADVWLQCSGEDEVKPSQFGLFVVYLLDFCFANLVSSLSCIDQCMALLAELQWAAMMESTWCHHTLFGGSLEAGINFLHSIKISKWLSTPSVSTNINTYLQSPLQRKRPIKPSHVSVLLWNCWRNKGGSHNYTAASSIIIRLITLLTWIAWNRYVGWWGVDRTEWNTIECNNRTHRMVLRVIEWKILKQNRMQQNEVEDNNRIEWNPIEFNTIEKNGTE